jgi:hypothetical protein
VQTFLPYPDIMRSAQCLDYRRLGKQRVEARQLITAIDFDGGGWSNHPAALMWRGYRPALIHYGNVMIWEWERRGYRNTMKGIAVEVTEYPPWFGDLDFHASHRSNLLRKDPVYYGQFGWTEPDNLEYVWPCKKA